MPQHNPTTDKFARNRMIVSRIPARDGQPESWTARAMYRDPEKGQRYHRRQLTRRTAENAIDAMIIRLLGLGVPDEIVDALVAQVSTDPEASK